MANQEWSPLNVIGAVCKGRYIRTRQRLPDRPNDVVINNPAAPRKVTLEKGAVGYCYAGTGVIHVGFTRDFQMRQLASPSSYPYVVTFDWKDIRFLEML